MGPLPTSNWVCSFVPVTGGLSELLTERTEGLSSLVLLCELLI